MHIPTRVFPFETLSTAVARLRELLRLHLRETSGGYAAITFTQDHVELMPQGTDRRVIDQARKELDTINGLLRARSGLPSGASCVTGFELMGDHLIAHLSQEVLCLTPLPPDEIAEQLLARYPLLPTKSAPHTPAKRHRTTGAEKPAVPLRPNIRVPKQAPVFVSRRH